ncbi:MAG: hypothetical protein WBA43_19110 [Elainellaceae cyanobacterium]
MRDFLQNPEAAAESTPAPEQKGKRSQPSAPEQSDLTASVLAEFKAVEAEPRVRLTVDLVKSRHRQLKAVAQNLDTDMSTLVRTLIDKFLDEVNQ